MAFSKSRRSGNTADNTADPANRPTAYGKGIDLLSRREQSASELKGKLSRNGYDKDEADSALEQLQRSGFQDDRRFAEVLARSRAGRGYGPLRIAAELKSHRIADQTIRDACNAIDVDWLVVARDLYQRRFGDKPASSAAETAKRSAFLQRRGFDGATIRAAMQARNDMGDVD